ncbi:GntR family transcriptional regulator [Eubacterium sp. 1001713B170207_170306_E7]|uniref:GntR family transcriptional regulator n=1 Tax=Eubacterium sp. 1001713B170207_170306_E7 TaxID=2787097 RepID=UPI0018977AC1|nr:GntR family transcriptional regulator [Eubacterium sp. 1001713B170207_170306_E7]
MENNMDLRQVVYRVLLTQIQFGTFACGERLPTIEEAAKWFSVSLDTIRPAYNRLRREGVITLSQKLGAVVCAHYDAQASEAAVQELFAQRAAAMSDLGHVMPALFLHAQWCALRQATPERLDSLEASARQCEVPPPFKIIHQLQQIYATLQNDLLLRLVWRSYMFFHAPFLSVPEIVDSFNRQENPFLEIIALCRQKDWAGLWRALAAFQNRLSASLDQFCADRITARPGPEPEVFCWSAYQKTSQVCYTLARSLLSQICRGECAPGSFLPSQGRLAETHGVSLSTVRRTLSLLCGVGVTRSINGVGTQVLPLEESAQNCDFSNPAVRKRLVEFTQALQLLAFSCGPAARMTLDALDDGGVREWSAQLEQVRSLGRPELAPYVCLSFIAQHVPSPILQGVYRELDSLLLWGCPLRSLYGGREPLDNRFGPCLDTLTACLSGRDAQGLAAELEALLSGKVQFAVEQLVRLGFDRSQLVTVPEPRPVWQARGRA